MWATYPTGKLQPGPLSSEDCVISPSTKSIENTIPKPPKPLTPKFGQIEFGPTGGAISPGFSHCINPPPIKRSFPKNWPTLGSLTIKPWANQEGSKNRVFKNWPYLWEFLKFKPKKFKIKNEKAPKKTSSYTYEFYKTLAPKYIFNFKILGHRVFLKPCKTKF